MFNTQRLDDSMINHISTIRYSINNRIIPESYPRYFTDYINPNRWTDRDETIKCMGFSLISLDWIKPLSQWINNRKCLEVMAGSGCLSYALRQEKVNIISTDDYSWKTNNWRDNERMWMDVENLDAIESVKKYGRNVDIIIMSWPYMDNTGTQVLKAMREVNSNCVMIYIGEGSGGCTADDEFFNIMSEVEDEFFYNSVKEYKQWYGIHDRPYLIK